MLHEWHLPGGVARCHHHQIDRISKDRHSPPTPITPNHSSERKATKKKDTHAALPVLALRLPRRTPTRARRTLAPDNLHVLLRSRLHLHIRPILRRRLPKTEAQQIHPTAHTRKRHDQSPLDPEKEPRQPRDVPQNTSPRAQASPPPRGTYPPTASSAGAPAPPPLPPHSHLHPPPTNAPSSPSPPPPPPQTVSGPPADALPSSRDPPFPAAHPGRAASTTRPADVLSIKRMMSTAA